MHADEHEEFTRAEMRPYVDRARRRELADQAAAAVRNELTRADDLNTAVPRLLAACRNEAREVRRSINAITSAQVGEAHRALGTLRSCKARVAELREAFIQQGDIIDGMETAASYPSLKKLHNFRENIAAVVRYTRALKDVHYRPLAEMIEEGSLRDVYAVLRDAQGVRRAVAADVGLVSARKQLQPYFQKADTAVLVLVMKVGEVLRTSLQTAVDRAAATEEDEDVAAMPNDEELERFPDFHLLRECIDVCADEIETPILPIGDKAAAPAAAAAGRRPPPPPSDDDDDDDDDGGGGGGGAATAGMSRSVTTETVREAVRVSAADLWQDFAMKSIGDVLNEADALLEALNNGLQTHLFALELTLLPLSTKLPFFSFSVAMIHENLVRTMRLFVAPDAHTNAQTLLTLLNYVREYRALLDDSNWLQHVNDSSLSRLMADMLSAAIVGMEEHLTQLSRGSAMMPINLGAKALHLNPPDNFLTSPGAIDMFHALQQSLSAITSRMDLKVMQDFGRACVAAMRAFIDEGQERLDADAWLEDNLAKEKPLDEQQSSDLRLDFLIAYCNDVTTIEDNIETVSTTFARCWDEPDVDHAHAAGDDAAAAMATADPFEALLAQLPDVGVAYVEAIVEAIARPCAGEWGHVFTDPAWFAGHDEEHHPTGLISGTLVDYASDKLGLLRERWCKKATRQLLLYFFKTYVNRLVAVMRSSTKDSIAAGPFAQALRADRERIEAIWSQLLEEGGGGGGGGSTRDLLDTVLEALRVVESFFTVEPQLLSTFFGRNVRERFGDCPSLLPLSIFARRDDLDKKGREDAARAWEAAIAFQRRGKDDDRPTVNWDKPTSLLGQTDRGLAATGAAPAKARGWFGKLAKKGAPVESPEEKAKREKKEKREAKKAANAEKAKKQKSRNAAQAVETDSLDALLAQQK